MTAALLLTIIAGLLIYGLQRNHARQGRGPELAGSVNFTDRDADRVNADLAAAADLSRTHGHRRQAGRDVFRIRAA